MLRVCNGFVPISSQPQDNRQPQGIHKHGLAGVAFGDEPPLLTGMAFANSLFGYQMDLQMGIESFGHALQEGEGW